MRILALLLLAGGLLAQGQGRRDLWTRVKQWDADDDGKVSRDEFRGPERFFERMDGDRDGFVTEKEARSMRRSGGGDRGGQGGARMLQRFDKDGNGDVSKAEWDGFFDKADDNEDGILDAGELRAALGGRAYTDTAPKVGDAAPKVAAKRATNDELVNLARVRRTTVLVFGSWT